jgi:hypothetical protein
LFVDVGAFSIKVYSAIFQYNGTSPGKSDNALVKQTSYEWTENIGSRTFAEKYASVNNITIGKAQKKLITPGIELPDFSRELQILNATVSRALKRAERELLIEELQVFGGGSLYPFIVDKIKRVVRLTPLRDFDARGALALGACVRALVRDSSSPYVPVKMALLPPHTLDVNCSDQLQPFWSGSQAILREITFEKLDKICEVFSINGRLGLLPDGVDTLFNKLGVAEPVEDLGDPPYNATFWRIASEASVESVKFCGIQADKCRTYGLYMPSPLNESIMDGAQQFAADYMHSKNNSFVRKDIIQQVTLLEERVKKINDQKIESVYRPTSALIADLENITSLIEKDELESMEWPDLESWRRKANKYSRLLNRDSEEKVNN